MASEGFCVATGGGVGDEDSLGEGGNEFVALGCARDRRAAQCRWEWGEDQQAALVRRLVPRSRDAHVLDAAGWANDDGLIASQEQSQAFLFHRRLEPADHGDVRIPHRPREVIHLEDDIAGAPAGAEQRGQISIKD